VTKLQRRLLGEPDDVREVPFGRIETYDMGDLRVGRSILEPGWRWSESIKPIARTDLCEFHHLGLCLAGSARIRMRDIGFVDRGLHDLKGIDEQRRLYLVDSAD